MSERRYSDNPKEISERNEDLSTFVDIDSLALGTTVRNDAVQTDIGAIVVILAGDADDACLQVEVKPVVMVDAVDDIGIRGILFQQFYEIRLHSVIAALWDVERQISRQLIIAIASLLRQGFQIVDGFLPQPDYLEVFFFIIIDADK